MTSMQHQVLVRSAVPSSCLEKTSEVVLGIDEAGRGPVLGPMVYGAAYWDKSMDDEMQTKGFNDSKQLSAASREQIFDQMKETVDLGWIVRILSAAEISDSMQLQTSNLNELSRSAAVQLIKETQDKGVNVTKVYVDTVGDPQKYQNWLTKYFNDTIDFTVAKKADSIYKVVSAASIAAKVTRDKILEEWDWETPSIELEKSFGSGYPSDPRTKEWLQKNIQPIFAFPNIVRFSWGTVTSILEDGKSTVAVDWPHDKTLEKKNAPKGTSNISSFLGSKPKAQGRANFFKQRGMQDVQDF